MKVSETSIRDPSNLPLLIPVVIGLVRWFHPRSVFTERDWLLLFWKSPRESLHTASLIPVRCLPLGRVIRLLGLRMEVT
jgi:hypothetical protein